MKKLFFVLALSSTLVLSACGGSKTPETPETPKAEATTSTGGESETSDKATSGIKMGIGESFSVAKSTAATDKPGLVQVDSTVATVLLDENGKIINLSIDGGQTKIDFDKTGTITSDIQAAQQTKKELGDGYGMKAASSIKKEWHEQIQALENWAKGKTLDEIKSGIDSDNDLKSSVTINTSVYLNAIEEAIQKSKPVTGDVEKTGLAMLISAGDSKNVSDKDGTVQVDTTIAFVALDKENKISNVNIEMAKTSVDFNKEGNLITDVSKDQATKTELGDDYGMKVASSIKKEWYEQIQALEDWMKGKTLEEIKSQVDSDTDLKSSVTLKASVYVDAVEKAILNSK